MTIATLRARLTEEDVHRLVRAQNADDRAMAARKICLRLEDAVLTDAERAAAREVLDFMAKDAAVAVRKALAVTLRASNNLPRPIAQRLAADIDDIACPVIEQSPVLTEDDLVALVKASGVQKQVAVAGRAVVPTRVVHALVESGARPAVARVAENPGAAFDEAAYRHTLDRFGDDEAITGRLIDRAMLPVSIAERLVNLVSEDALQRLVSRHALPAQMAVELSEGARERATIDILDQAGVAQDMKRFVQQLQLNARLTPSLILRGVCLGHMGFFEHAVAELAGIPHQKAWLLVHDAGPLGLRAVCERAGLPARMFAAIRAAVDIHHELQADGALADRRRFAQTMVERVLTQHQGMSRDELDYLLDKLDAFVAARLDRDTDTADADDTYVETAPRPAFGAGALRAAR